MGMFLRRGPAPSVGTPIGSLDVGSKIKLNVNGTAKEFLIVHQGLPSSIYDASCDGTWLLMKDIYINQVFANPESNVYENSAIDTYLNGEFLGLLETKAQNAIKQVKIPYCSGGGKNGTVQNGADGHSCKIFLTSVYELGCPVSVNPAYRVDGAKLSYFESGSGTSANQKRMAFYDGNASSWWARSPNISSTNSMGIVYYFDGHITSASAIYRYGVRPAFILPTSFKVTDDMLAT